MNETDVVVTVVISAYKLEKYLPSCLDDLIGQTFQAFDVVIIDDASPDRTLEIAREYEKRMPDKFRVRSLEKNTGTAAAVRNTALDEGDIKGEYVVFLDGDDDIEPDFLERLVTAARERNADVAICAFDRLDEDTLRATKPELGWLADGREIRKDAGDLAYVNTALWNKLIRREVIGDARIPQIRIGEDALFSMMLYENCERFAFVEKPLLHYRVRSLSAMSNTNMSDIVSFGSQFASLYAQSNESDMLETIALSAFLHIGLSMSIRAAANRDISIFEFCSWARKLFGESFNGFKDAVLLRIRPLSKKGGLGIAIWLAKWAYKLGLAPAMLLVMRLFSRSICKRAYW